MVGDTMGNFGQSSGSVGSGIHSSTYIMNIMTLSNSSPARSLRREQVPHVFVFFYRILTCEWNILIVICFVFFHWFV